MQPYFFSKNRARQHHILVGEYPSNDPYIFSAVPCPSFDIEVSLSTAC